MPKFCETCGTRLMWVFKDRAGYDDRTGKPLDMQILTCPKAEKENWFKRLWNCHDVHPHDCGYDDYGVFTRTVVSKERINL